MRLLCLSDLHGRDDALTAVLGAAAPKGFDQVLVAGDHCFPGPRPLATWRRLERIGAVCVQGIGDRALVTVDPTALRPRDEFERARLERLAEIRAELGPENIGKIGMLSTSYRARLPAGGELLLIHGSPVDPLEPMSHDLSDDELLRLLGDDPAVLVLCGGSHVPFDRSLERPRGPDGVPDLVRVVNLGSVGEAPGLDGEGRRFADATFVRCSVDGIEVEQIVVPLGHAS